MTNVFVYAIPPPPPPAATGSFSAPYPLFIGVIVLLVLLAMPAVREFLDELVSVFSNTEDDPATQEEDDGGEPQILHTETPDWLDMSFYDEPDIA